MTLIGGATPIGARLAVHEAPPMVLAWARFGLAGALLWLTQHVTGEKPRPALTRRDHLALWGLALLCVPLNQAGFLGGIRLANASHSALFYALTPVIVFWMSVALRRRYYSHLMLTAALLAFAGAACVLGPGIEWTGTAGGDGNRMLIGDLLLLFAVLTWSAFIVISADVTRRLGAIWTLTRVFLLGALLQTPFALFGLRDFVPAHVTWRGLAGFGFITLVSSFLGYLLTYLVLARADATRAMVFVNSQFLLTILFEHVLFDVPLTGWFTLGSALIVGAV